MINITKESLIAEVTAYNYDFYYDCAKTQDFVDEVGVDKAHTVLVEVLQKTPAKHMHVQPPRVIGESTVIVIVHYSTILADDVYVKIFECRGYPLIDIHRAEY